MLVDINRQILSWAREESGMTIESAALALKLNSIDLKKWEEVGKDVPFNILEGVARLYKRQAAIFFLTKVPEKNKKPKDYRNLNVAGGNFSPDVMLAIRRTDRYLRVAKELVDDDTLARQYEWTKIFNKKDSIEEQIILLKKILDIKTVDSGRKKRSDASFRYWRSAIEEKLGIFVFQFSMPEDELDGFSYTLDKFPYAIVINNKHAHVRKIFTLFHELAHILNNHSGACKTDFTSNNISSIELDCNNFAGKFLAPDTDIRQTKSVDDIFNFAGVLNISGETYLRRLFDTQKISRQEFFDLLSLIKIKSNNLPRKNKEAGPISRVILSKSTRGVKFFNLVSGAAEINKISFSRASDLLGLKVSNIKL